MKFCSNCGKEVSKESKFCANCGKEISTEEVTSVTEVSKEDVKNQNQVVKQYKVRLYTSKCKRHRAHTTWYFDDMEVTKEWLLENEYMTKAQYNHKSNGDTPFIEFSIENLISLG